MKTEGDIYKKINGLLKSKITNLEHLSEYVRGKDENLIKLTKVQIKDIDKELSIYEWIISK